MAKDLEYYLAQARRIAEHREADAEKEIRKLYKEMRKDLQTFISDTYVKYAQDDKLTFAMLQKAGYDARFLEEIERQINISSPKASKELQQLVNDTYKIAYEGMVNGVIKAGKGSLDETFADAVAITPQQIKKVVRNPIMEVALEKNHKDIITEIKEAVAVGLMNGDRYTTMARRISDLLNAEKGAYKRAVRIARTEAHRVREAGNSDAAAEVDSELQNTTSGMRMVKTWHTMRDERVRPQRRRKGKGGWSTKMGKGANHMKLDGQIVLANESFDLLDGNKAPAPGQSGVAGHDINCRCYASYEMMTDEEFYEKTGKHFPGYKEEKGGILQSFNSADYKELDYMEYKELAKAASYNEGLDWDAADETVKGPGPKIDFSSEEAFNRTHKIQNAQMALYKSYTGTTNSYQINKYLREHDTLGDTPLDRDIRTLDDIIGSWKSTSKMSVTRFVTDDYLTSTFGGNALSDILQNIGTVITEKQFLSTSANEAINVFSDKRHCKLKMYVDEGTVCFPTLNYGESEIIFPRGTKYEIVGAEENNGMINVIVKVLK